MAGTNVDILGVRRRLLVEIYNVEDVPDACLTIKERCWIMIW